MTHKSLKSLIGSDKSLKSLIGSGSSLRSLKSDTQGLTTVEYIILLFCVAIPAIAAWQGLHCEIDSHAGLASWEISHSLGR